MALMLVSDVRESSSSNRKTRRGLDGQFPRVKPRATKTSAAGANTGHVKSRGEDPPSTCKLAFTNCYLGLPESLYLPTVPRAFTQCPCSTSLCDPVNSNLAVHHPLPTPPSPFNCRPTNYHTSHTTPTMDSADAIPESVWNVLDQLARVPKWMWAAGAVVGLSGIIVLVFPFPVQYLTMLQLASERSAQ